jgi:hypothetical protein
LKIWSRCFATMVSVRYSTSYPTIWALAAPIIRGGSTYSSGARSRNTRDGSISIGTPMGATLRASCLSLRWRPVRGGAGVRSAHPLL